LTHPAAAIEEEKRDSKKTKKEAAKNRAFKGLIPRLMSGKGHP
jgi:hypothetical protein